MEVIAMKIMNRGKQWPRISTDLNLNDNKTLRLEFTVFDDMITLDINMEPYGWKYIGNISNEYTAGWYERRCEEDLVENFFGLLKEKGGQDENKNGI
jgi:hypothetical protein